MIHRSLRCRTASHAAALACGLAVWVAAAGGPVESRADDLCGCWEGHWHGCTDGLQGIVKARITKCGANKYEAVFSGWAFKIMPYRYTAILTGCADPATGKVRFKCTMKLPIWGCYWMKGTAKGCNFYARYHTDDHVGYFKMKRVCCD